MAKKSQPHSPHSPQLKQLQDQVEYLTAALQRERADAVNARRRHDEQIDSLRTVVKSQVIAQLLPVIDNFERALQHVPKELAANDYVKGVEQIVNQFSRILQDLGVERIPTVGHPFDPHYHEAVSLEGEHSGPEIISEELQAGYRLQETVIRPAMVRVMTQPSAPQ